MASPVSGSRSADLADLAEGTLHDHAAGRVAEDLDASLDGAVPIAHGHDSHVHADPPAVLVPEEQAFSNGTALLHRPAHRAIVMAEAATLRVEVVQPSGVIVPADDLAARVPGETFRGPVPVQDASLGIDEADRVLELIEQLLVELRPQEARFVRGRRGRGSVRPRPDSSRTVEATSSEGLTGLV